MRSERKKEMFHIVSVVPYFAEGALLADISFDTVRQMEDWRREFYRFRYELKHANAEMYEQSRWLHTEVYERAILLNDSEDVLKILVYKRPPREPQERPQFIEEI